MAQLHSKYVNGNLVYYAIREDKWIDAVGMTVRKYIEDFAGPTAVGADNADPMGWTLTPLTGDAGDSSIAVSNEAGGAIIITTDDTENDGINVTVNNEAFTLAVGDPTYFGVRLKVSDADATDLIVGLTIDDAEMWGGMTDGIYFESADAVATCTFVTELDSSETSDTSAGTLLDDTYSELEFYWDGVDTVKAYFDNCLVATSSTTVPTDEPLKFSLELLAGSAGAKTCSVDWIRIIQCQ